jgi:light-regulated signal transduction histidine kinase (bacteriophytochrome)
MPIAEAGAIVTHDPMPVVTCDPTQIGQVFQNLITNAVKFRGDEPPRVHVSARESDGEWTFSVADNGIGIEAEYFDRIFVIFQRLQGRAEYPGSGVGLAICKRIIERHGGRAWVESQPGTGSTFYFTLRD